MVDINVHGVIFGMKVALPRMRARNAGHIVNLASVAGRGGFPHAATYCATKHAVLGVSEAVRAELRDTPIEISCVLPALVNTELGSGIEAGRAVDKIEPEDVAAAIVETLRSPRFEVFVPRSAGRISKVMQLLPRPGREAIARWLKADRILTEVDAAGRATYTERTRSLDTHASEAPEQDAREPVTGA
jgi:short-subunit dehydrogenase